MKKVYCRENSNAIEWKGERDVDQVLILTLLRENLLIGQQFRI